MTVGEILADLRRQCGTWADADAIQEAMTRAIELEPSRRGAQLRDAALKCLEEIREERHWARRRGAAVSGRSPTVLSHANPSKPGSANASAPGLLTPKRRKQGKKHRQPRGVATSHAFDTGFHVIPTCEAVVPDERIRSACALLGPELRLCAYGELLSNRAAELVLELYQEFSGVAPEHHWGRVLIDEIGFAKMQMLRNAEIDHHRDIPLCSTVTLKPVGGEAVSSKPVRVPIVTMMIPSAPGRAMRAVYQQVGDDEFALLGVETLARREVPSTYSQMAIERAQQILTVARDKLRKLPWPQTLPSYADDPTLVAWLYRRAGFEGRGGQEAVQNRTLCDWLSDPGELATEIERYAKRRSERCTDAEAEVLEEGLLELANLVRERAGIGPAGAGQAGL